MKPDKSVCLCVCEEEEQFSKLKQTRDTNLSRLFWTVWTKMFSIRERIFCYNNQWLSNEYNLLPKYRYMYIYRPKSINANSLSIIFQQTMQHPNGTLNIQYKSIDANEWMHSLHSHCIIRRTAISWSSSRSQLFSHHGSSSGIVESLIRP